MHRRVEDTHHNLFMAGFIRPVNFLDSHNTSKGAADEVVCPFHLRPHLLRLHLQKEMENKKKKRDLCTTQP